MKTRVLKVCLLACCMAYLVPIVNAQESSDNLTYYYNNFETATAGTIGSLGASGVGNAARTSSSVTIDASTTTPLAGLTSLRSATASNAISAIRWDFVGNGTTPVDLSANDFEWNFIYKNTSTSANSDPDVITSGTNSWRYWLVANGYTTNNMQGIYVTHYGTTLKLRYRYDAGNIAGHYNELLSATLPNDQQTYMIKLQRLKDGRWALYADVYVAGMTTAKTYITSTGTGTTGSGFSNYYYSYLESTTTTTGRFQWDNFDMYTRVIQFTTTGANNAVNNITQPAYSENQNVNMYGLKIISRGNFIVNQFALNTVGAGFEGYFNGSGSLYKSDDSYFSTSSDALITSVALTANAIQNYSFTDYISSSGNTDGTYSVPGYYFINATVKSQLNYGNAPTGTITVTSINTFMGNGNSSAITYTGPSSNGNVITFANAVDWTGASSTDWGTPSNWSPARVPLSTDAARIGVAVQTISGFTGFKNQPILSVSNSCAMLTFGVQKAVTLTLTNATLNVSGGVSQIHNSANGGVTTTITGTLAGSLICNSFTVGDNTAPPGPSGVVLLGGVAPTANNTTINCSIPSLIINGDFTLNSTSSPLQNYTILLVPRSNYSVNNPVFNLNSGILTANNLVTTNTSYVDNDDGNVRITNSAIYNGDTGSGNTTLNLLGATPVTVATGGFVDFTAGGTGTGIVNYASTATSATQKVYTTADASIGNTPNYDNLTLSAASAKMVDGGLLTINANLNTSGGAVDLAANDPTVTVGGSWTNAAAVTQDSGPITIIGSVINSGTLNLGTADLKIAVNYTNNVGGIYTQSTGTTNFNGIGAQALVDNSTTGTVFKKVTFTGGNTATMGAGTNNVNFFVASTGLLSLTNNSKLVAGTASVPYLTLLSDASSSGSIDQITGTSSITGYVNANRYMTGGVIARRGYRLLSAPVNQGTVSGKLSGQLAYGFTDLQKTTPITGYTASGAAYSSATAPTNAFDQSLLGNPTVFFYNEADIDPINQQFINSDYKGIASIGEKLPIGNGFLFFFRGSRSVAGFNGANKTSTSSVPENTTLNWTGVPNQGPITVYIPTSPITSDGTHKIYTTPAAAAPALSFTSHTSANDGMHLIGNPYASAIDLDAITVTNPSTNKFIYMLNNANTFGVYTRGSGSATLNNGVGRYVASGQGFFVVGNSSGTTTVGFKESAKVNAIPSGTAPTTFMTTNKPTVLAMTKKGATDLAFNASSIINATPVQTATPAVVNITLLRDSDNMNETVIQFGDKSTSGSNKYNQAEDAIYRSGISQTTFMASYTADNKPCIINTMGALDTVKSVPLYVEGNVDGLYTLNFKGAKTIDSRYILYLVDHFMKDSLDLSANDTYKFTLQRGNSQTFGATRFELVKHKSGLQYNLLGFNGAKKTGSVVLNWKTEHEGTYTMFALQRSTDGGKTFVTIDSLASDGSGNYTMTDVKPANGTNQYRLVQTVGLDPSALSKIVIIGYQPPGNDNLIANFDLFPNPSVDVIKLRLNNITQGKLSIKIYNVDGRVVSNSKATAGGTISQDVSKLLHGGYVLEVSNADGSYYATKKFSKL